MCPEEAQATKVEQDAENISLRSMTYQEFYNWCSNRVCDGKWCMKDAIVCTGIISEIQKIKVGTLFRKRKTREAREKAWREIRMIFK